LILLDCNPQKNRALGLIKLVCSHKRQSAADGYLPGKFIKWY
jgi:hypothetical protein